MKRALIVLAILIASQAAQAQSLSVSVNRTRFPAHWFLDKGPRVIHVTPFNDYEPNLSTAPSPSLAVPYHMKTEAEAVAEARAQSRQCLPVRVTTEDGSFLHAPSECRR